jgi:hypothetical protein
VRCSGAVGDSPFERLRPIGSQRVQVAPLLTHHEVFTMGGLLTMLWHGVGDEAGVVVCGGGAMGGLLGPADGLYHDLGVALTEHGIATIRVGWRRPNDLDSCLLDMLAVLQLAAAAGAARAVTMGHSFGGAPAVQAGCVADDMVTGVVTFATQSAGCEMADVLRDKQVLCFHGDADTILPPVCSELVSGLSGGELVVLPGDDHLLSKSGDLLRERLLAWIPAALR